MPCFTPDPGPSEEELLERKMPSVLCAVVRKFGLEAINSIDWKEAGVSKGDFLRWWNEHERKDTARREREAERELADAERKAAVSKLNAAERILLGIKD